MRNKTQSSLLAALLLSPVLIGSVANAQGEVPSFDKQDFLGGVKNRGIDLGFNRGGPIDGARLSNIQVFGTSYNSSSRTMLVWSLANLTSDSVVTFVSECHLLIEGGWECTKPVSANGSFRIH